jgi:hypothetical protein
MSFRLVTLFTAHLDVAHDCNLQFTIFFYLIIAFLQSTQGT